MARKKLGRQSVRFENPPVIIGSSSIVGKKENDGPLGKYFDMFLNDDMWGEKTFEKAEKRFFSEAIKLAIKKTGLKEEQIDCLIGGDLLNQIITAGFAARDFAIPFLGLYGACSTMAESLVLGSCLIDGGFADYVVCATSSHFSTAERQFRFPLELGNQRTPTSQWTVTGAGASILAANGTGPVITGATFGKIVDMGIKDVNNMGAAMAPAALDTIVTHFNDNNLTPDYYDLIITGDLGKLGREILMEKAFEMGLDLSNRYTDCGCEIYSPEQDTHQGGSGCGCSAVVLNGYLIKKLTDKTYNRILFAATGAMMSTTSSMQGESIPSIVYALSLESR